MIKTSYQVPELRNANDEVVQEGAFGKNTALSNSTNDGWIDYVMNDLEALHDTIGDSAATLDGNGHVTEPANYAIGDEDGNRLKTSYLKLSGGTVTGTTNFQQNVKFQDNQENVFGGVYVPASSVSSQYLALYGGESPASTDYASALFLYPVGDGRFILRSKSTDNSTNYELVGGSDGTLKWRGNTLAHINSPAFSGNPTAPTQATNNNSTRLATTEYVKNNINANLFQLSPSSQLISNGDDLNDYTTAGTYFCNSSTVAASLSNCPYTSSNFKLVVNQSSSASYMQQYLFAGATRGVYIRSRNNGNWGQWGVFALSENVLSLSGGTITGLINRNMVNPSSGTGFQITYTGITKGVNPSSTRYGDLIHSIDAEGDQLAGIQYYVSSSGVSQTRLFNNWHGAFWVSAYSSSASASYFFANADNATQLGSSNYRWKQLYAGTATINTSDERLKGNITAIPNEVLDAWGEVGWYQYQFNDSIAEKGESRARIHTGAIAQRIESVFTAHGLDANRYGLLCYDEWNATPAERDENGNITEPAKPAGNRYSLRYEEALCMEAAYQRRRADRLEERIARLEALVNQS